MGRLKKVDPKFFTVEDLEAVRDGKEKWKAVCDGDYRGDITDCALCDLATDRVPSTGETWCYRFCVLWQAHDDGEIGDYGCIGHFTGALNWYDDTFFGSKRDARSIYLHLENIERQITKGLEAKGGE